MYVTQFFTENAIKILFGSSFALSTITVYMFYHQEIKKNISRDITLSSFIVDWGFDIPLFIRIIIYGFGYAFSIYFYQFGLVLLLLLICKFDIFVAFAYHHMNPGDVRSKK